MPKKMDPTKEYIIKPELEDYRIISGRDIYEQVSATGLNRAPIIKLRSFIEAGLVITGTQPFSVKECDARMLIDGSFAAFTKPIIYAPEGMFLDDLISVEAGRVIQGIRENNDPEEPFVDDMRRVYILEGAAWNIYDEKFQDGEWRTYNEAGAFPADAFIAYPNGRGILFFVQMLYHRIEEIQNILREQSSAEALATIVTGFLGDQEQAELAFTTGRRRVMFMPGNASVTRLRSTDVITQLLEEQRALEVKYDEAVFDYLASEMSDESGVSRRLKMSPMLQFVRGMRDRLREIFKPLGVTLEFDKVQVQTVEERTAEYALIKTMRDDGVIAPEEFRERAIELGV